MFSKGCTIAWIDFLWIWLLPTSFCWTAALSILIALLITDARQLKVCQSGVRELLPAFTTISLRATARLDTISNKATRLIAQKISRLWGLLSPVRNKTPGCGQLDGANKCRLNNGSPTERLFLLLHLSPLFCFFLFKRLSSISCANAKCLNKQLKRGGKLLGV